MAEHALAFTHITAIRNSHSRTIRVETTAPVSMGGQVVRAVLVLGANVRGTSNITWEIPIHAVLHDPTNLHEPYLATEFAVPHSRTKHFHTFGRFLKPGDEVMADITYTNPLQPTGFSSNERWYWATVDLVVERHTTKGTQTHWFNMLTLQIPFSSNGE